MFESDMEERINSVVEDLLEKTADMTPTRAAFHVCYLLAMIKDDVADVIKDRYAKRKGE